MIASLEKRAIQNCIVGQGGGVKIGVRRQRMAKHKISKHESRTSTNIVSDAASKINLKHSFGYSSGKSRLGFVEEVI